MAKYWISLPLATASDPKDESVVSFLKGGTKKGLEVEVAAFITKWLMDRDIPFGIDFDSCGVDRALVIESLPKRLQKILGATASVVAEPGELVSHEGAEAPQSAEDAGLAPAAVPEVAETTDPPSSDGGVTERVELP